MKFVEALTSKMAKLIRLPTQNVLKKLEYPEIEFAHSEIGNLLFANCNC